MKKKIRVLISILLSIGWISFIPAHAETLSEYNSRVEIAQQIVTNAQTAMNTAQYNYDNNLIEQVSATGSGLAATVYNNYGYNNAPPIPPDRPIILNTTVSQINFQWGSGGILGTQYSEDVIVKFEGYISSPITQNINFYAPADDGVKLIIDGSEIINDWYDKGGGGTTSADISFTAGIAKPITFWYYENGGGAWVQLYWNINGSMEIVPESWFGSSTSIIMIKDPALLIILQQKQEELVAAQQNLAAIGPYIYPPINSPTNLSVNISGNNVILNWNAPSEGTMPERYAVSWSTSVSNGWGIATGNVGDSNALNTSISIPVSVVNTDGLDKAYVFNIRSDNDTLHMYSGLSNLVSIVVPDQARIAAEQAAAAESARIAAIAEQQRLAAIESARIAAEQAAAAESARIAAIAEQQRLAALAVEQARLQKEAAAKLAAEREADRLAAEAAAKAKAERLAAEAAAKKAEEDRLAAIEAARVQAEKDRLAAEAAAKAEAKKIADQKALSGGEITAEDAKKVLDNINADGKVTQAEVKGIVDAIKQSDAPLTSEQKDLIATVVIAAAVSSGENVTAAQIQDAGIQYKDLPKETPVEVRTSESGEVLIITAEVATQTELVQDPAALAAELFTDPGAAIAALGSIGADMTPGEREEATKMVVATVIATGAALNAVGAATTVASSTGGSTGGSRSGGSNSGGSGGGGASGNSKGVRRREP